MIYIAGPLFSEAERKFNQKVSKMLEDMGHTTFLPQRDGHELHAMLNNGMRWEEANMKIFQLDTEAIRNSDMVIFIMDGRVPDEGACVEIGYAYALGKECIGLKTDCRSLMANYDNPMIIGALKGRIARNLKELARYIKEIEINNESVIDLEDKVPEICID